MIVKDSFFQTIQWKLLHQLPGANAQSSMMPPSRGPLQKGIPEGAKLGAVVILLWRELEELQVLLMRRTASGGAHSAQISFPGGQLDAQDASFTFTALRELEEEMGISSSNICILGSLTPLYIPPSNFYVQPILCVCENKPSIKASANEVEEVIILPLQKIINSKKMCSVARSDDANARMETIAYATSDEIIIWGATAMMLAELGELVAIDNL
jgi:8-oxo-dGTP pyrophosphatase MutT (NUDIX family)